MEKWLIHAQGYLATQTGVTDQQVLGASIAALPTEVISLVQNVIIRPPEDRKCDTLKATVRDHYARSDEELYKEIQQIQLGEDRPSPLFRRMATLNARTKMHLPKELLRSIHFSKIQVDMQLNLDALTADKDDYAYCSIANRMYQRHKSLQASINVTLSERSNIVVNSVCNDITGASDCVSPINTMFSEKSNCVVDSVCSDITGASDHGPHIYDPLTRFSSVNSAVSRNIHSSNSADKQSVQQLREEMAEVRKLRRQLTYKNQMPRSVVPPRDSSTMPALMRKHSDVPSLAACC
ncbi:uncharacterized protein LOC143035251 [Oratosquilla oratoria]|uniref:uncharacterized protein LOC143035251 n=1 Tax=Oratosquilla oratoria TaxID=337810 RepID=UPI003F770982